jgi:hypothetical protein
MVWPGAWQRVLRPGGFLRMTCSVINEVELELGRPQGPKRHSAD